MIPSVLGMIGTRINYDMLDYLPDDMDTVIGQNELLEDFGKGAFSLIIVEDMPDRDVAALCDKIKEVDHVETVIWYSTLADISVPKELLPDKIYDEFNTDHSTMMAVFFDSATSADVTMDAIREIRSIAGRQCFVSGMSALVTDLKDLCEKGGADLRRHRRPSCNGCNACFPRRMACAVCISCVDRNDDPAQSRNELLLRRDIVHNKRLFLRSFSLRSRWTIRYSCGTATTNSVRSSATPRKRWRLQ